MNRGRLGLYYTFIRVQIGQHEYSRNFQPFFEKCNYIMPVSLRNTMVQRGEIGLVSGDDRRTHIGLVSDKEVIYLRFQSQLSISSQSCDS